LLTTFEPATAEEILERILIYSWPGFGKSRLATSLPNTKKWGEIVYYAADEGSEFLGSTLAKYRKRVHVIKPAPDDGQAKHDPLLNFTEFALHDWKAEFPKARTVIVDTYDKIMFDILRDCANKGSMSQEKHYQFGAPGAPGSIAIPNRSDYFAIQNISRGLIDTLFHYQRDMNIICVFHEDAVTTEGAGLMGGPSHPGRQMALEIPSKFNSVFRLMREPVVVEATGEVKLQVSAMTESYGQFVAKIRESAGGEGNPMPKVVLDNDPVNFWTQYDARDLAVANTQEALS
jgi:hypothetical protein